MTWARLDDSFAFHPKAVAAPLDAVGAWTRALSYAAQHLTDGFVPRGILAAICGSAAEADRIGAVLESVRLFDPGVAGWQIHDFHDYNPEAKAVKAKRKADLRRKKNSARIPRGIASDSNRPVPVPVPVVEEPSGSAPPTGSEPHQERFGLEPPAAAVDAGIDRAAAALVQALVEASAGRVAAVKPTRGQVFAHRRLAKVHADPEAWRLVGAWLAAGGESWRTALDVRAIGGNFEAWLVHASAWNQAGRPVVASTSRPTSGRTGRAGVGDWSSGNPGEL